MTLEGSNPSSPTTFFFSREERVLNAIMEPGCLLRLNRIEGPLVFERIFGRRAPVEIEIGFGKGLFLVQEAEKNPDRDYVGIEMSTKYVKWTHRLLAKMELTNVRIVREEAHYFLDRYVPRSSVSRVHVYHPDPWPKRRHRKRRLVTGDFIDLLGRCLVEGGEIRLATDFEEYFEAMTRSFGSHPGFAPTANDEAIWEGWLTNFARKYSLEGRPIYRVAYTRRT